MKTVKQLAAEINEANLVSPSWAEDEIDLDGAVEITTQDRDEHRWVWLGAVVYKIGDEYFGNHGPASLMTLACSAPRPRWRRFRP